jgi:hypothetical protein
VQQSTPWPNTTGSLTQTAIGLNGVVRFGRAAGVSATVSGGLTVHRFGGTVQPLAYTSFRLGGHSVLFQDDYRLSASFEPSTAVGWNGGGDVSIAMGPRVAFLVGYRYLGSAGQDTSLRPTAILNSDQVVSPQTIGEIANQLGPLHARLSLSGSRFLVGVKFRR